MKDFGPTAPARVGVGRPCVEPVAGVAVSVTTCSQSVSPGSTVTLTASPSSGSSFAGWGGDCSGYGTYSTCTLVISSNTNVVAYFETSHTLSVSLIDAGPGNLSYIYSSVGNIDCSEGSVGTCSATFPHGTTVYLYMVPVPNSSVYFSQWTGACVNQGNPCALTMTTDMATVGRTYCPFGC